MAGCDPKFFFGENVGVGNLNTESCIPDIDIADSHYSAAPRGHNPDTPVNENPIWSNNDISGQKYSPDQGPWGIIPSRSVMISNLPKTTQLWTLVELLKVILLSNTLRLIVGSR